MRGANRPPHHSEEPSPGWDARATLEDAPDGDSNPLVSEAASIISELDALTPATDNLRLSLLMKTYQARGRHGDRPEETLVVEPTPQVTAPTTPTTQLNEFPSPTGSRDWTITTTNKKKKKTSPERLTNRFSPLADPEEASTSLSPEVQAYLAQRGLSAIKTTEATHTRAPRLPIIPNRLSGLASLLPPDVHTTGEPTPPPSSSGTTVSGVSSEVSLPLLQSNPTKYKLLLHDKPAESFPVKPTRIAVSGFLTILQGNYRKLHWRVNGKPILDHSSTNDTNHEASAIVASHLHSILNAKVGTYDHARDWAKAIEAEAEAGHGIEAFRILSKRLLAPMAADRDADLGAWRDFAHKLGESPSKAMTRLQDVADRLVDHGIKHSETTIKDWYVGALLSGPYAEKLTDLKHERDHGRLLFSDQAPHDVAHRFTTALTLRGVIADGEMISKNRPMARVADGGRNESDSTLSPDGIP